MRGKSGLSKKAGNQGSTVFLFHYFSPHIYLEFLLPLMINKYYNKYYPLLSDYLKLRPNFFLIDNLKFNTIIQII